MSDSIDSELLQKWVNAIKSGDPKQVTDLYNEDAILLGTFSNKERIGHALILEYFENLLKSPAEVEIISEHFSTSEIFAVNSGHYNFVVSGKGFKDTRLVDYGIGLRLSTNVFGLGA